ncbi:isotrichodermin C-15 hydroxylase [Phaeosphaeria sp. MPI-PUGE-AT-0046c]|nr:isotrichodermin C-15 hydroxylase [Phaeosphaeria sp. MPI-PUGE-AT-0046c]
MALPSQLWQWLISGISNTRFLAGVASTVFLYTLARIVYNLHFHPLSKYPGPRLAAATDLWWAYASISGRYPWKIEAALQRYGDIVRVAPNELVFITPQAAKDIYLAQEKNLELFVQIGYDALDTGDNGITGEPNPFRHREIAKKLAPAFSTRNLKAKEATILKHVNLFVQRMKETGASEHGAGMQAWTDRLGLDLAADMVYGHEMHQVRDMKDSIFLSATLKLNLFLTMSQVTRKFRLHLLPYLTIPISVWYVMPQLISMHSQDFKKRMERRGNTEHLDYFETLMPYDKPVPADKKDIYHLENVGGQLLLASWQPLTNQFYSLIFFALREPTRYALLVKELREAFSSDEDIDMDSISNMRYLNACVQEGLRLHQDTVDGLPRLSPGALVDGNFIPKGVTCQISYFAAPRSPRYFADPLKFRPERWLAQDDARFDVKYKGDNLKATKPFSQGLRGCPGGAIAMSIIRLFIAKVTWEFDLEEVPGQDELDFDKDFKFMTFWERPQYQVRFKSLR